MPNDKGYKVFDDRPIVFANRSCPYCTVCLDGENRTKEHVVGRRFVPKGKFAGTWNLILNACQTCNGRKAELEDDVSAITMQPDVSGVHAISDEVLSRDALRKSKSISRRTKKPVSQSRETLTVAGPLIGGASIKFEFVGPPQLDPARAYELAAFHVDAFFYWLTFDEEAGTGRRMPGDFYPLILAGRRDWGNPALVAFMDKVIEWEPLLVAPAADGFFKIAIRRHRDPLCWAWAVEWNHSYRVVGFIGNEENVRHHADGIGPLPAHTAVNEPRRIVRYRVETPLEEVKDTLFVWNDAPTAAGAPMGHQED